MQKYYYDSVRQKYKPKISSAKHSEVELRILQTEHGHSSYHH